MFIKKVIQEPGFAKATIELSYDEIMRLSNILYHASLSEEYYLDNRFNELHKDMYALFMLVKAGHFDKFDIDTMHKIMHEDEKEEMNNVKMVY